MLKNILSPALFLSLIFLVDFSIAKSNSINSNLKLKFVELEKKSKEYIDENPSASNNTYTLIKNKKNGEIRKKVTLNHCFSASEFSLEEFLQELNFALNLSRQNIYSLRARNIAFKNDVRAQDLELLSDIEAEITRSTNEINRLSDILDHACPVEMSKSLDPLDEARIALNNTKDRQNEFHAELRAEEIAKHIHILAMDTLFFQLLPLYRDEYENDLPTIKDFAQTEFNNLHDQLKIISDLYPSNSYVSDLFMNEREVTKIAYKRLFSFHDSVHLNYSYNSSMFELFYPCKRSSQRGPNFLYCMIQIPLP